MTASDCCGQSGLKLSVRDSLASPLVEAMAFLMFARLACFVLRHALVHAASMHLSSPELDRLVSLRCATLQDIKIRIDKTNYSNSAPAEEGQGASERRAREGERQRGVRGPLGESAQADALACPRRWRRVGGSVARASPVGLPRFCVCPPFLPRAAPRAGVEVTARRPAPQMSSKRQKTPCNCVPLAVGGLHLATL